MNLYDKYILPKVTHLACSQSPTMRQRKKVIPLAHGRVLEIGIGSGLNFSFYDADKVEQLFGLDPSAEMRSIAQRKIEQGSFPLEYLQGMAEEIPLESKSMDCIVITYTLCTIPDVATAFEEMRRVLKPGGELIFCEHGSAPDKSVARWQDRINPIWKRLGGGCHLNRNTPELIRAGGFDILQLESMYLPGFKPLSFNYWGIAKPG